MAIPRASVASCILASNLMLPIISTIFATCSFDAFPFPVTDCLIFLGSYSAIGIDFEKAKDITGYVIGAVRLWTRASLVTLGIVHTGLMYVLLYGAIQKLPTALTGALSFIYPIAAIFVDWFAFGHRLEILQSSENRVKTVRAWKASTKVTAEQAQD